MALHTRLAAWLEARGRGPEQSHGHDRAGPGGTNIPDGAAAMEPEGGRGGADRGVRPGRGRAESSTGSLIRDALVLREVRQENVQLRARVERIKDLESQIAQLDQSGRQLYTLAGVPDTLIGDRRRCGRQRRR